LSAEQGNVAGAFSISAVAVIGLAGGVVDYMAMSSAKTSLQAVTDAAVIASARELQLSGGTSTKTTQIEQIAKSYVTTSIKKDLVLTDLSADVSADKSIVKLDVSTTLKVNFLQLFGLNSTQVISASATAQLYGGLPLCVLALEEKRARAIGAFSSAELTATGCTIYSNSTRSNGIEAWGKSRLSSGLTCSAGGAAGGNSNYLTTPVSDCPKLPDPLASRISPPVVGCDFNNFEVNKGTVTLTPGVYCGGLKITGKSKVTFSPGDYIIKDEKFEITAQSVVTGNDVAFFLTGKNAFLGFHGKADISLKGRETGVMAGLLFFEDRNNPDTFKHEITTDYARVLEGTIYLPNSEFIISSKTGGGGTGVAAGSAYTVIIANILTLTSSPKLILNTDYASSAVPVPANISKMSGDVSLVR
jgi:hypothetical protein